MSAAKSSSVAAVASEMRSFTPWGVGRTSTK